MKIRRDYIVYAVLLILIVGYILINPIKNTSNSGSSNANTNTLNSSDQADIIAESQKYPRYIELVSPDGYINIDYINISDNIGKKVILIDFWDYSCINCQRTIPYLNSWYDKYKDQGLLIIGVHSPEFDFEKNYDNLKNAVNKYGIKYPVVQDNEFNTWNAYNNRYWPHEFFIDINGFIVYDHIGEGNYDETEAEIQMLLEQRNKVLKQNGQINTSVSIVNATAVDFGKIASQEIYLGYGYQRGQIGNKESWQQEMNVSYQYPGTFAEGYFYLNGTWFNNKDNMELESPVGSIKVPYDSKNVYIVAGSNNGVDVDVYVDGIKINTINVKNFDLYSLVLGKDYGQHTLEIKPEKPGLMVYTFTFG